MESTAIILTLCPPYRKEPFALLLKLLIFLTIYTRRPAHCNCVPLELEARNFKIPALGRTVHLGGSLYDARTDKFTDIDIFKSNIPRHLIPTIETPRISTVSQIIKKESDKFKIFGLDLDTAASIKLGIVKPEGAASVLTEYFTSVKGVTGIFLQTFQTAEQTLPIFHDELRNYYNTDAADIYEEATHIVTGISWGGSFAVTISDTPSNKRGPVQSYNVIKEEFLKLKRISGNYTDHPSSGFEMHLTSDVSLQQNALPTTLTEVRGELNHVQESIKNTNSGLGVPLKFTLTPISVFKKYLNNTTLKSAMSYSVNAKILRKFLNMLRDIQRLSTGFINLEENSNCVPKEIITEIENLHSNFSEAEELFKIQFKNALHGVKFGALNNSALFEIFDNYTSQDFSPKNVRITLNRNKQVLQKVHFCSQLNEEYPDIEYFGSASNLISKIYQNHNKRSYVLFIKSEFQENDRASYEDNLNIFLNLLYKPTNALFIVDCDFSYAQCESIDGTVIKQIRRGNYTFDDVRMEIKITEMENKTEIVECNKESGQITGAFCVLPVERKPSKLESGTLNSNQTKKPEPEEFQRSKVVGGSAANPNEFPFQVLFLNSDIVHCGGTILSESFILTAAHCLHDYDVEDYESWTIVAGEHNRDIDEGTEQRRQIQDVHIHKKYIPIVDVNDMAIVKLVRPLQLSKEVQPILLPDADYEARGNAVVTGWGKIRSRGNGNPLLLQKVKVPIVDRADCVKAYEDQQVFISIKMMCAGDVVEGGVDACEGDSGGPLSVQLSNGSSMLVGIVSSGIGCGRAEYPGIYMQVSKYVDWINETLTNFECLLREPCQNGGTCVSEITPFSCICAAGFDGKVCEHVKECHYPGRCSPSIDPGNCRRCRDGFVKDPEDNTRCQCERSNESLIISSRVGIIMVSLDGQKTTQMIQNGDNVFGTDFNFQINTMFWFSKTDFKIYSAPINAESGKTSIMHDKSSWIFGIAVDWIYNNIYWVDAERNELYVSNFNGTMKKVLFNDGLSWPTSIAVNPLNGWMYWTDKAKYHIERAGMDGSRREIILTSTNREAPKGLIVDLADNRLYWSIKKDPSSIWSSDFDGSDRKLVFTANPSQFSTSDIRKIAIFNENIYWTDFYGKTVYKVNKCSGEEFAQIYKAKSHLEDIKIYHETLQPKGENVCLRRIGQCSHFCFPVPSTGNGSVTTTTCDCPVGLLLSSDGQNCVEE